MTICNNSFPTVCPMDAKSLWLWPQKFLISFSTFNMLVPLIFPTLDDDHLIFFMIIFIHSKSIIIHYSTSQQMIRPIIVASKKEFRFVVLLLQHKSTRSVDLKTNGLDPDKPHFPRENVQACATTMSPYSSFFSTINCPEMVENAEYSWITRLQQWWVDIPSM